jgi:hypothetical protein
MMRVGRMRVSIALLILVLASAAGDLRAAVRSYPDVLYGGMNVITLKADKGIQRILWRNGGALREARSGHRTDNLRIVSVPSTKGCPKQLKIYLFVESVTREASIELHTFECGGSSSTQELQMGETWTVDHQEMGASRVGERICRSFRVTSRGGGSVVVDRVVVPSGNFELRFTAGRPPLRVLAGRTYRYDVCFQAQAPGRYKMPIHVYIRRDQPNGGFNSFIVADTAYITVVGPPPSRRPPPVRRVPPPRRDPPRRDPPRVRTEPIRPIEPPPKPRPIPDVDTVAPRIAARTGMPPVVADIRSASALAEIVEPPELSDPTTFRVVVLPTARSIEEGRTFIASYDIAGILVGHGVTDRLTVMAGGLVVPAFVGARTIDVTGGARYEFHRGDFTRVAAGLQLNHSDTDSSSITLVAPYIVASIGDDDSRASVALSYSARRHDPESGDPFNREAIVVAAGGDLRLGRHWKVAGEAAWIQSSSYQPVLATVRYFGESFAVDAGAVVNVGGGSAEVAPVVSLVWVLGR